MGQVCVEKSTGLVREWARHGTPSVYDPLVHDLIEQDDPPIANTKWNGTTWVTFTPPRPLRDLDLDDVRAKLDDIIADNVLPNKLRVLCTALKKILAY